MLASLQHINNLIYVEIFVPIQYERGQKLFFPYVDALLSYPCVGVVSFMRENIDNSIEGNGTILGTTTRQLYVTLVDQDNVSFISQIPYYQLTASNFNQPIFKFSKTRYLDLERCYISFNQGSFGRLAAVFVFEYLRNV
jgi:hypothetical protein